jgi:hypothetical protein
VLPQLHGLAHGITGTRAWQPMALWPTVHGSPWATAQALGAWRSRGSGGMAVRGDIKTVLDGTGGPGSDYSNTQMEGDGVSLVLEPG